MSFLSPRQGVDQLDQIICFLFRHCSFKLNKALKINILIRYFTNITLDNNQQINAVETPMANYIYALKASRHSGIAIFTNISWAVMGRKSTKL